MLYAGIEGSEDSQSISWVWKVIASLLGFGAGFFLIEIAVQHAARQFNGQITKRQKELGRPLLLNERNEVKEQMRAAAPTATDTYRSTFPLMRLVFRITILIVPSVILFGFLAALGAFLIGLGVAMLLTEITRRSLHHL